LLGYDYNLARNESFYNVLSFDGGGLRGVILAVVGDYLEGYAYNYSVSSGYIEENDLKKVALTDMF
jgi:hypothetical protein